MTNEGIKVGLDMARLCRSVLLEKKLKPDYLEQFDLDKLFSVCEYHCLTAMVCMALEYNGITPDAKWTQAKSKAIRKNMLLDAERAQITAFLEQEHIWYMPLKGSILKDFYPRAGMRQMSDNDILFDASRRKDVTHFMKNRGYYLKSDNGAHCDEWTKEPVYNFEMHLNLFTPGQDKTGYFTDVKNKLVRSSPEKYDYRFTDEDFYIYMTAHAFKHYSGGGTGFRTLTDYYIYLKEKETSMDWAYIHAELAKLSMDDFEKQIHSTAMKYFAPQIALNAEEKKMLRYMLGSGTYGNIDNWIDAQADRLNAKNKSTYLFRRFFPSMEWWRNYYPSTAKYPFLIVPFFFYRLLRMVTVRRKRIIEELRVIHHRNKKIYGRE